MSTSTDVSPSTTPCGTPLSGSNAPKFGTVIPNRIFVGGIAANTSEVELKQFFTSYGAVKDSKIIADRAGVSKGYGFITFESQEDADRIIKKEADNLVFKDRKLNIGPAIRKQQVLPRAFGLDGSLAETPGTVMFSNGVPYTYQNGMAVFHSPDGGYQIAAAAQAQAAQTALMVPQTPPMYVQPQYTTYQIPYALSQQTSPQWATPSSGQWRWAQSPTTAMATASPSYMLAMASPELMYAQMPPYQPAELTDATVLESAGVEGSIFPVESNTQAASQFASDVVTVQQQPTDPRPAKSPAVAAVYPFSPFYPAMSPAYQSANVNLTPAIPVTSSVTTTTSAASASSTTTPVSKLSTVVLPSPMMASYHKPYYALPSVPTRRPFAAPQTFLVRNGHKVQCVMVPPRSLSTNTVLQPSIDEDRASLRSTSSPVVTQI